jgi:anaerobic magnesium-protoporphyrin IX monomethyl ester cyclase
LVDNNMIARRRNEVLVVVPPNSNVALPGRLCTVTEPEEHSDWSNLLSLGALSLVSALRRNEALRPLYVDCTVIGLQPLLDYISKCHDRILAIGASVLTANYEAAIEIMRHAKSIDPSIRTIIGNDHFTALSRECLDQSPCVDYGFTGNEIIASAFALISRLYEGANISPGDHPSLVVRGEQGRIHVTPQAPEAVFSDYDYEQVDELFDHTSLYRRGFRARISPRIADLLGKHVSAGVPVDIGRGCVKFANDNACSFCSIQYGGLWRNALEPRAAWAAIERAWRSGHDYLYLTADELPLTFTQLLEGMLADQPSWWRQLPDDERPLIVGYARADGLSDPRKASMLRRLGIRQLMVGMDAGSALSLAALRKPLKASQGGEQLTAQNFRALRVARDTGLLVRCGFVLGHIGMTPELLNDNVAIIKALLSEGRDVISAVDIEVLSPEPGSRDFEYLLSPELALSAAKELKLAVADAPLLRLAAERWRGCDIVPPEESMRDYAAAFMPDIAFKQLIETRKEVRTFAKDLGIVVGESLVAV